MENQLDPPIEINQLARSKHKADIQKCELCPRYALYCSPMPIGGIIGKFVNKSKLLRSFCFFVSKPKYFP